MPQEYYLPMTRSLHPALRTTTKRSFGIAPGSTATLFAVTMLCAGAPFAAAQSTQTTEPFTVSGALAVGAEHNNNLSVAELESASGQSDTAATLDGSVNLQWQATPKFTVESGYSYTMSRYQDIDSFDLDLHLLFADVAYDFGAFTLGGNHYYALADLGGDGFLDLKQSSLYAGKLFGQNWYLRGALNTSDKNFDNFDQRDADNDGVSVDLYRFFNQGRSNVTLGYAREEEDTLGPSFDYTADTLRLRLSHRFQLASREATLQLGYRYQDRDYAAPTPSIGVPRDDSQRVADARIEVKLLGELAFVGRIEQGDYRSRLATADFSDRRIAAQLRYSF